MTWTGSIDTATAKIRHSVAEGTLVIGEGYEGTQDI